MSYKRHIDRLPIPPKDAKVQNVTCHYCIVGCGYKAISWPINQQGGPKPDQNVWGVDLSQQQGAETQSWYSPSMYNIVRQDGRDVHLVIQPDKECVVNSGLGSIRGSRMAEMTPSLVTGTQRQRLSTPLAWRFGMYQPTSWDDALSLVAEVTRRVVEEQGEDGLIVSAYDHGGAGGGYENTWATGKLYFDSMKVRNIRMHNRPAYNSEVHSQRDMGMSELNNAYEDAELCDTILAVGMNQLETQTNYFLNHWVPNLNGASSGKKQAMMPDEAHPPVRMVVVDPRRTTTLNACEFVAGADNVLHLSINAGTDLALFNALLGHIVDQGWTDQAFIYAHTSGFKEAVAESRMSVDEAAEICGVPAADIIKAASWIAEPKEDGKRRRTFTGYEKGVIWSNDNYRTIAAISALSLATGNIGRLGGGCCRLGGHQEGYARPSDAHIGRPAPYVDELLIAGKGGVHHIWGCDHFKTTLNATEFKRVYKRRTDMVKDAMTTAPAGDMSAQVDAIMAAIREGGLFSVDVDIVPTRIGAHSHVVLPAATSGEMNLTSMNGERRMRLTEKYMDPFGQSKPDCLIVAELAHKLEASWRAAGKPEIADKFKGYDWKTEEDAFMDGYHKNAVGGEFVTYERLRAMGTNGFQEPAIGFENGRIIGTARLYAEPSERAMSAGGQLGKTAPGTENTEGRFNTDDGKAKFLPTSWRGMKDAKVAEKEKFRFLINNGRTNHVWQSAYLDVGNEFVMDRWPYPFIELNPEDMADLGLSAGDLVEIHNDNGATQAIAHPTPSAKRNEAFMLFGFPTGVQGNVVSDVVNELIVPEYRLAWADIRRISGPPEAVKGNTFKSPLYVG